MLATVKYSIYIYQTSLLLPAASLLRTGREPQQISPYSFAIKIIFGQIVDEMKSALMEGCNAESHREEKGSKEVSKRLSNTY